MLYMENKLYLCTKYYKQTKIELYDLQISKNS